MEYLVPYNEWVETCSEEWSDHGSEKEWADYHAAEIGAVAFTLEDGLPPWEVKPSDTATWIQLLA